MSDELEPYRAVAREEATRIAKESDAPELAMAEYDFAAQGRETWTAIRESWSLLVEGFVKVWHELQAIVATNPDLFSRKATRLARREVRRRASCVPGTRPEHHAMHAEYHRRSKKRKGKK